MIREVFSFGAVTVTLVAAAMFALLAIGIAVINAIW